MAWERLRGKGGDTRVARARTSSERVLATNFLLHHHPVPDQHSAVMAASTSSADVMVARHLPEYVDDRAAGSYFPNPDPGSSDRFMTWQYVVDVLSHGDLDQLFRDPVCDTAYRAFAPAARAKYDGLENYIRHVRLGWPTEERTGPAPPNMLDRPQKDPTSILSSGTSTPSGSGVQTPNGTLLPREAVKETWPEKVLPHPNRAGIVLRHFVADAESDTESSLVKTIPNDWPYGIPAGSSHWVVWSKLPILHPSLFTTDDSPFDEALRDELYDCVTGRRHPRFHGLCTPPPRRTPHTRGGRCRFPRCSGRTHRPSCTIRHRAGRLSKELVSQAHAWASRHVTQYIEAKWPPSRFQTAWFCNPPSLRTVPGLSHFQ
ncbi:hypothetical protein L1887_55181 [Cichorium endivia]|nr:hypothetical protein L1887_55181 [Cichorium endivia]